MKRIFFVIIVLFAVSAAVYAQQAGTAPTQAQIRQMAQEYLNQARANGSQFESMLNELKLRNGAGLSMNTFNQLKAEIDRLESRIQTEATLITAILDRGGKVASDRLITLERLINQHQDKQDELEELISN